MRKELFIAYFKTLFLFSGGVAAEKNQCVSVRMASPGTLSYMLRSAQLSRSVMSTLKQFCYDTEIE